MISSQEPLLQVRGLCKTFPGARALDGVDLEVRAGEVHALMGENGAGKSTLMRMIAGIDQPDSGTIRFGGEWVAFPSPHAALQRGIAMIHQELMPFPHLSVAENVFIGREPANGMGWIDRRTMERRAGEVLEQLGVSVHPAAQMASLSIATMQTVEIARALVQQARLLIMDEPTSATSDREVESLFRIIRSLRDAGVAVIYISHKLDEVFRIADRITVLRDGRKVAVREPGQTSPTDLIQLMAGRELSEAEGQRVSAGTDQPGEVLLSVKNLGFADRFHHCTFELRRGEVLGLAGLMGAGRTDLVSSLFGMAPAATGQIFIAGKSVDIQSPRDAIEHGIALVSEDRQRFGLVLNMSVRQNLTLSGLRRCCRGWFIDGAREDSLAREQVRALGIKSAGGHEPVKWLSGGNQQKVVLARALLNEPPIVLLDEPTRGIDVNAKAEVHRIIAQLASEGRAVLMVSSEMPELLSLSHRILVMRQGTLVAEVNPRQATPSEILAHAMPL